MSLKLLVVKYHFLHVACYFGAGTVVGARRDNAARLVDYHAGDVGARMNGAHGAPAEARVYLHDVQGAAVKVAYQLDGDGAEQLQFRQSRTRQHDSLRAVNGDAAHHVASGHLQAPPGAMAVAVKSPRT